MARTPAQNAAIYAARNAKARAEGWSSYSQKRRAIKEVMKYESGRSKAAVKRREQLAVQRRDYQPGSKSKQQIQDLFQDFPDDFFEEEGDFWDYLDELSPKGE